MRASMSAFGGKADIGIGAETAVGFGTYLARAKAWAKWMLHLSPGGQPLASNVDRLCGRGSLSPLMRPEICAPLPAPCAYLVLTREQQGANRIWLTP